MNYRRNVVREAKSWIGTPYKHYTSKKGLGADCALFVMQVYANLGLIKEYKPAFYSPDWAMHKPVGEKFEESVKQYCDETSKDKLALGDLILYYFGKCMSHAAILIESDMIIHSEKPIGVTVSNRYTSKWYKRERKYYTLKKGV